MVKATPRKVSLIVSDLSSKGSGRWGGAVRPFLLAQALQKLGYEVEMLGLVYDEEPIPPHLAGIPVKSFPCQTYSGFFKASQKLISSISGDLVYAVKLKPSSFGISLAAKLVNRQPLLLDIDDWEMSWYGGDEWRYRPSPKDLARAIFKPDGELRFPDHPLYLQNIEKLVHWANGITTQTKFLQNRFGGTYIPSGKDTTLFDPNLYDPRESRTKYGLTDYRVLMFPGAPRPYKGLEDILTALEQLNQEDLRLVIVGGSPYDRYDQELIERWGRWIILLPKLSVDKMPEVVAGSHVIVVPQQDTPATRAQFPLKITDGMAMAKPVLATRVGDIPEILGETGYLAESSSPASLANKIKEIFADEQKAIARGKLARSRCIEYYSLEAMADILQGVIDRL